MLWGREFVGLIHAFRVLRIDATPCGQPISVSTAHAICEPAAHGPFSQLLGAIEESKRPQVLEALHLLKDAANAIH